MRFEDKVACITGAGRGIGYALAEAFKTEGAQVFILEKDAELGQQAATTLGVTFIQLDVTDAVAVRRAVEAVVAQAGRIDVWINNAGVAHMGLAVDLSPEDWDTDIAVNLSGPFYCAQQAGRVMIEQGSGAMVNIASVNGLFAQEARGPYAAAKAGLIMLTKVLASEWGAHNVRVNAVAPGVIVTDMVREAYDTGLVSPQKVISRTPMGRPGEMREIVEAVLFLADNAESSFMTGEVLRVDGGWTAYHLFYPFEEAF